MLLVLIFLIEVKLLECFYYDEQLYVLKYKDYLEAQGNLTKDLFKNYEKDVSPVYTWFDTTKPMGYDPDAPKRWNYTLFLYNLKLIEVNEPEEQVSVVLELMEYWYDARLSWNASDYNNVTAIFTRQEKVWSPTLTPFGVNELIDFRDQDFRLVCLDNLGQIYDYLSVRVSTNCRMNVAKFPFDTQTCQIRFSLPLFSYLEVQMFNEIYEGIKNAERFETMGNSEWDLINLNNRIDFLSFQDRFDVELAVFEIKIARNPLYYIYMIVFPSFIINTVSILGVFLKGADRMSKLNVGLTNIMTMTFILGVMADRIPRTGTIPLLGIYIIINLIIMVASVGIILLLPNIRKWVFRRLQKRKTSMSARVETFFGTPIEYTFAVMLEVATCTNFIVMIAFWIDDSE